MRDTRQFCLANGGDAIRDICEKFAANSVTGIGSMRVPICSVLHIAATEKLRQQIPSGGELTIQQCNPAMMDKLA